MKKIKNKLSMAEEGYWVTTSKWFNNGISGFYFVYKVDKIYVYLLYGDSVYRYMKTAYPDWVFWTDSLKYRGYRKEESYADNLEMENKSR